MNKRIYIGRVDEDDVFVNVRFTDKKEGTTLSICGEIGKHSSGQNIGEIAKLFPNDKKAQRIHEIWKRWHLNDLRAGDKRQMEAIRNYEKQEGKLNYEKACIFLKGMGLYESGGIKYGYKWHFEPIPDRIIREIETFELK